MPTTAGQHFFLTENRGVKKKATMSDFEHGVASFAFKNLTGFEFIN